jgi:hypothetical protein
LTTACAKRKPPERIEEINRQNEKNRDKGPGRRNLGINAGRGWLKERRGSGGLIVTNVLLTKRVLWFFQDFNLLNNFGNMGICSICKE